MLSIWDNYELTFTGEPTNDKNHNFVFYVVILSRNRCDLHNVYATVFCYNHTCLWDFYRRIQVTDRTEVTQLDSYLFARHSLVTVTCVV